LARKSSYCVELCKSFGYVNNAAAAAAAVDGPDAVVVAVAAAAADAEVVEDGRFAVVLVLLMLLEDEENTLVRDDDDDLAAVAVDTAVHVATAAAAAVYGFCDRIGSTRSDARNRELSNESRNKDPFEEEGRLYLFVEVADIAFSKAFSFLSVVVVVKEEAVLGVFVFVVT
jgi:hypothetical protein